MTIEGRQILSTLTADGAITAEIVPFTLPTPTGNQVVVRVEAAPINPSDLSMLFGPADIEQGEYSPGKVVARMAPNFAAMMRARHGLPLPMGVECAGTVIAAGDGAAAQAILGKRVSCVTRTAFATHAMTEAPMTIALPDDVTAAQGASTFVNPMTALGFVETMRRDGFSGIVHTAAASNLGRMLIRICAADGVPLVNIVRKPDQVALLRGLGAEHVLDSTAPDFQERLTDAIAATGAMAGFDAIGGGTMSSQILAAMERAALRANTDQAFTLYGSNVPKKVYIYGALDLGPTILDRSLDFRWQLAAWLLPPFLASCEPEVARRLRARVLAELKTTFASHYEAQIDLDAMLSREAVLAYNARRSGEKYLLVPNG